MEDTQVIPEDWPISLRSAAGQAMGVPEIQLASRPWRLPKVFFALLPSQTASLRFLFFLFFNG